MSISSPSTTRDMRQLCGCIRCQYSGICCRKQIERNILQSFATIVSKGGGDLDVVWCPGGTCSAMPVQICCWSQAISSLEPTHPHQDLSTAVCFLPLCSPNLWCIPVSGNHKFDVISPIETGLLAFQVKTGSQQDKKNNQHDTGVVALYALCDHVWIVMRSGIAH